MKEQRNIDPIGRHELSPEDRELYGLLAAYANAPIFPEKDRAAKNMLLRSELKTQLKTLVARQPDISFKDAVFVLLNDLPEEDDIAYHLAVYIVAKYLPALSVGKLATA
jgi:hypothetical protein